MTPYPLGLILGKTSAPRRPFFQLLHSLCRWRSASIYPHHPYSRSLALSRYERLTTYRPVSTRRSSPSRIIAFMVLPKSLARPSSWRVCTGLRPSGCSWSSATIRRRMSPRGVDSFGSLLSRPGLAVEQFVDRALLPLSFPCKRRQTFRLKLASDLRETQAAGAHLMQPGHEGGFSLFR